MCENHRTICPCKIQGFQNVKITQYRYYLYINLVSFLFMMSWYEVCAIYILTKFVQLFWCNFAQKYVNLMY
jgi:hypothetical protein